MRLNALELCDVMRRHVLDAFMRRLLTIETLRLQPVEWLVIAQLVAELGKLQHADQIRRNVEEQRLGSSWLDGDQ